MKKLSLFTSRGEAEYNFEKVYVNRNAHNVFCNVESQTLEKQLIYFNVISNLHFQLNFINILSSTLFRKANTHKRNFVVSDYSLQENLIDRFMCSMNTLHSISNFEEKEFKSTKVNESDFLRFKKKNDQKK